MCTKCYVCDQFIPYTEQKSKTNFILSLLFHFGVFYVKGVMEAKERSTFRGNVNEMTHIYEHQEVYFGANGLINQIHKHYV